MSILRRVVWKACDRIGGRARRWAWNDQFSRGHWDWMSQRPADLIDLYGRYCQNGVVVDLGCGQGHLADHLARFQYRLYYGLDVSEAAVQSARERTAGKPTHFTSGDLASWRERIEANLIIFEESLYYVRPWTRAIELVEHALSCLRADGAVIVVIHSVEKWSELCRLLEKHPACETAMRRGERWLGVLTHGANSLAPRSHLESAPRVTPAESSS